MRSWQLDLLFSLLLVILAALSTSPIWEDLDRDRVPELNDDWDNQLVLAESQRESVVDHGVWPLWNQYSEGGSPLLANPESNVAYPLSWISLLMGIQKGLKLQIVIHLGLGLLGCYFCARSLNLEPLSAAYCASAFMLSSIFPERMRAGHLMWMGMAWMPWVLRAGLDWTRRNVTVSVVALSALWLMGAHYLALFSAVGLVLMRLVEGLRGSKHSVAVSVGVLALFLAGSRIPENWHGYILLIFIVILTLSHRRTMPRELSRLFWLGALVCSCTAIKLLPSLELLSFSIRFLSVEQVLPPNGGILADLAKWAGIMARDIVEIHEDQPTFFHVLPLLLAAVATIRPQREVRNLVIVVLFAWAWSEGDRALFSVSSFASDLPILSVVRYPARASVLVFLGISLLSGLGLDRILNGIRRIDSGRWRAVATVLLAMICLVSVGRMSQRSADTYPGTFQGRVDEEPVRPPIFKREECTTSMYQAWKRNRGCVNGFSAIPLTNARHVLAEGSEGYRGEVFLAGTDGEAKVMRRGPNEIETVVVGLEEGERNGFVAGGRLVLNQSYFPGWHLDDGRKAYSWQGLMATDVVEGQSRYTFIYRSTYLVVGLILSVLGWLALSFWAIWGGRA